MPEGEREVAGRCGCCQERGRARGRGHGRGAMPGVGGWVSPSLRHDRGRNMASGSATCRPRRLAMLMRARSTAQAGQGSGLCARAAQRSPARQPARRPAHAAAHPRAGYRWACTGGSDGGGGGGAYPTACPSGSGWPGSPPKRAAAPRPAAAARTPPGPGPASRRGPSLRGRRQREARLGARRTPRRAPGRSLDRMFTPHLLTSFLVAFISHALKRETLLADRPGACGPEIHRQRHQQSEGRAHGPHNELGRPGETGSTAALARFCALHSSGHTFTGTAETRPLSLPRLPALASLALKAHSLTRQQLDEQGAWPLEFIARTAPCLD